MIEYLKKDSIPLKYIKFDVNKKKKTNKKQKTKKNKNSSRLIGVIPRGYPWDKLLGLGEPYPLKSKIRLVVERLLKIC